MFDLFIHQLEGEVKALIGGGHSIFHIIMKNEKRNFKQILKSAGETALTY